MMKKHNSYALTLIGLHLLLAVYSLSGFFSKNAAAQPFLSWQYIAFYCGMMAILVLYAVGWQQVIKRLPLTLAFANKAVTVVWGILWGALFFHESITPGKLIGAAVIVAGVVLFVKADGDEKRHE
ncbi:EamA family transporter [Allofournierella sp. CML151]|uniref:EamA family transporter n=1 Tax=Allofournierella sp. CML151 TaxID=2998082 RepID=UPI0022EA6121|nr:EamA family transporter [Fournierella sp. CML151]